LDTAASRSARIQTDDTLKTLAAEAGGEAFFPSTADQYSGAFSAIDGALHGYQIAYQRTGQPQLGTPNLTVELVNPQTSQRLKMVDQSGAEIRYKVVVTQMP
jgi:hypothetical protein